MAEELKVRFSISEKIFLSSVFRILIGDRSYKFILLISLSVIAIILASIFEGIDLSAPDSKLKNIKLFLLFPVLAIIVPIVNHYKSAKLYRENRNRFNNLTYIINRDGMEIISEHSTKLTWDRFKHYLNAKKIVYLFVTEKQAQIFPKSALTENELAVLIEFFRQNEISEIKW